MGDYKACLVIRRLGTDEEVDRIGVRSLNERHIERVMLGIIHKLRDGLYVDDSEVDAARARRQPLPMDGNDYHHFGEC